MLVTTPDLKARTARKRRKSRCQRQTLTTSARWRWRVCTGIRVPWWVVKSSPRSRNSLPWLSPSWPGQKSTPLRRSPQSWQGGKSAKTTPPKMTKTAQPASMANDWKILGAFAFAFCYSSFNMYKFCIDFPRYCFLGRKMVSKWFDFGAYLTLSGCREIWEFRFW